MASGSFKEYIRDNKEFIKVWWSSTPIAGENASDVSVYAKMYRPVAINSNSSTSSSGSVVKPTTRDIVVTVEGAKKTAARANWTGKGWTTEFGKFTFRVPHNSDGNKSVDITFTVNLNLYLDGKYYDDINVAKEVKLDSLAKSSTFTLNKTSIKIGETVDITLSDNPTPDVRHSIVCKINNNKSVKILKKADDNGTTLKYAFVPSADDFLPNMPKSSISTTITVTTYKNANSTTVLGTYSKTLTVNIRATDIPSLDVNKITLTPVPVDENTNTNIYIRGKSAINVKIEPTISTGSSIKKYYYKISANGDYKYLESGTFDTHIIRHYGESVPVYFKVTDGRGMTSKEVSKNITVHNYYKPTIQSMSIKRCASDGTISSTGTNMKLTVKFNFPSCNNSNKLNIEVKRKRKTSSTYSVIDTITEFNDYESLTYTKIYTDTHPLDVSYDFLVVATDMFGYEVKGLNDVFTREVLVDMSQHGVAIGKQSERGTKTKGAFEVGWESYFDDVSANTLKVSTLYVGPEDGSRKQPSLSGHTHSKLVYDDGTDETPYTVVQAGYSNLKFEGEDEDSASKDVYALLPKEDGTTILGFTDRRFYSIQAHRGGIGTFYADTARAKVKLTTPLANITTLNSTTINLDGKELKHGHLTHYDSGRYLLLTSDKLNDVTQYFLRPDSITNSSGESAYRWNLGGATYRFNFVFARDGDFLRSLSTDGDLSVKGFTSIGGRLFLQNNTGLRGMKKGKTNPQYDDSVCLCYVNDNNRVIFGDSENGIVDASKDDGVATEIRSPLGIHLKCGGVTGDDNKCTVSFVHVLPNKDAITKVPYFRPGSNGSTNLGGAAHRWDNVYCVSLSQSSDRKIKKNIKTLDEKYVKLFDLLNPVSYEFINGNSGRTHTGFIAQDVEDAIKKVGLTNEEFAGLCKDTRYEYDEKDTPHPVLDENGNEIKDYSLRYTEFIALQTAKIKQLEKELNELKAKVN